jgi:DNA primase
MAGVDPRFLADVKARTSLVDLVGASVPLRRAGRVHKAPCPFHNEKTPSFFVDEKRASWRCYGCGAHGDAVSWVQETMHLDFGAAVEEMAIRAGLRPDSEGRRRPEAEIVKRPSQRDERIEREKLEEWAARIWRAAVPAPGTLVETYLRARGITIPLPPTLRFAASLMESDTKLRLPAMVAPMQAADRRVIGVHRTYLARDGQGKAGIKSAKKMGGTAWGTAIRLAAAGPTLGIAEGIETGLSVMQACPGLPVWVAGSLGNLAGAGDPEQQGTPHPDDEAKVVPTPVPDMTRPGWLPPSSTREVILLADADGDPHIGRALLERAARRFRALGLRVRVAWPEAGKDFNDMLRGAA